MKTGIYIGILFLSTGLLHAQQPGGNAGLPDKVVRDYFSVTQEHALLYNGKEYVPYEKTTLNHPYLKSDKFVEGTISMGGIVYPHIPMKLDLFRDELVLLPPRNNHPVVAEKERIDYVLLNGYRVINPAVRNWEKQLGDGYALLLSDGRYPVIKKYHLTYEEEIEGLSVKASYRIKERFYVVKAGKCYPVKNKGALLNLFPDKKKELNRYARKLKLDFRREPEQAFVALVQHYETSYGQPEETEVRTVLFDRTERTPVDTSRNIPTYSFVLDDKNLITSLPDNFFGKSGTEEKNTDYVSILHQQREQKATSENKVYTIGDASAASTDKINLSGHVTDFRTGEPVVGAVIYIENPAIAATTDAFGFYSLRLPAGRHNLQIRGIGLKDTQRQILLQAEGRLDIELEEEVYSLKEVTVTSERLANVRSSLLGADRVSFKEIKNIPTAFGEKDVIRVVMMLPGVKSVGEVSSGFNVRGGSTDQNLILFNGGTIYNPTHLFGLFSVFNADLIKNVEL